MDVPSAENEENIQLGGNIELIGFSVIDRAQMVVVKKIVGNYARKFSEMAKDFEKLSLSLKKIHAIENSENYEISAKLMAGGKPLNGSVTDRNLFFGIDKVLKIIEGMIKK
ncbi:hypothetical protein COV21_02535 [Candidatus Woesearchaeota archaeon CG10_big_fil_rev_8_21_14_0_10_45_5]|jgi:ribosome-associated translation inhibitor RaiA|nr:MAG: hypothetical protein COV21_02535 [Candidatus Woesearchaeota archaeon CG10_big_fil_rev_8_21_14_0_10_45_5]PIU30385.1 MAG: hypothetical protein COT07_01000 [Candidatus Woesearchaeota archaeon CG07_land_8_20_14_0_80_44_23]